MANKARNQTVPVPKDEESARLGALFREAREAKEVGLKRMAEALGVSVNTIRWHEAGDTLMRADTVRKAADFLGVTAGSLLGDPEPARTRKAAAHV